MQLKDFVLINTGKSFDSFRKGHRSYYAGVRQRASRRGTERPEDHKQN